MTLEPVIYRLQIRAFYRLSYPGRGGYEGAINGTLR